MLLAEVQLTMLSYYALSYVFPVIFNICSGIKWVSVSLNYKWNVDQWIYVYHNIVCYFASNLYLFFFYAILCNIFYFVTILLFRWFFLWFWSSIFVAERLN